MADGGKFESVNGEELEQNIELNWETKYESVEQKEENFNINQEEEKEEYSLIPRKPDDGTIPENILEFLYP